MRNLNWSWGFSISFMLLISRICPDMSTKQIRSVFSKQTPNVCAGNSRRNDAWEICPSNTLHCSGSDELKMSSSNRFLYFAYGSNLLSRRIHLNNPTAERVNAAKLKDYRLDFNYWSKRWGGYAATIVPHEGRCVWGAVWSIDKSNLDNLDEQEGVGNGVYEPIEIKVETKCGKELTCRSYKLAQQPAAPEDEHLWCSDRPPSKIYWEVIVKGAIESDLPGEYITDLQKIPHNGYTGNRNVDNITGIDIPIYLH